MGEPQLEDVAVRRLLVAIENRTANLQNWYSHADQRLTEITRRYNLAAELTVRILIDTENQIAEATVSAARSGQEVARLLQVLDEVKNETNRCAQEVKVVSAEIGQVVKQSKDESAKNAKRDEFCGLIRGTSRQFSLSKLKELENQNRAALKDLYDKMTISKQQNQQVVCQLQQLSEDVNNARLQTVSCVAKIAQTQAEIKRVVAETLPIAQEVKVCKERTKNLKRFEVAINDQGRALRECQEFLANGIQMLKLKRAINRTYREAKVREAKNAERLPRAYNVNLHYDRCVAGGGAGETLLDWATRYPSLQPIIDFLGGPRPPDNSIQAGFSELPKERQEAVLKIQDECRTLWEYGKNIASIVQQEDATGIPTV